MEDKHIVFITDDNYVMPTHVVITSIMENNSNTNFVIHICTFGLNSENMNLLNSLHYSNLKVDIRLMNLEDYEEKFSKIKQRTHVTPTALIKFDLPYIFPELDTLLYLDSDIIVNKSLEQLFLTDLSSNYLAGSFEYWHYLLELYNFDKNNIPDFYFNSGVMLLNLKKLREDNIPDKLWNVKYSMFNDLSNKVKMMDQDALNFVLAKNCVQLPIKYNCNCYFTKGIDYNGINLIYKTNYSSCSDIFKDAVIIHYVGKADKPWKYIQGNCVKEWDFYYEKSGYNLRDLKRTVYGKGIKYKIERFKKSIKDRGFVNTIKYIIYKNKMKRS